MNDRRGLARTIAAMAIVAIACPGALVAGALLGCATEGFSPECAMEGIMFSPFILIGAGLVAGLLIGGWTGAGLTFVAVAVGMMLILVWSAIVGRLVPIDPFEASIATTWFSVPVLFGYGIGRVVARIAGRASA